MASSSEFGAIPPETAKESLPTSSTYTIIDSDRSEIIALGQPELQQEAAVETKDAEESSSTAEDPTEILARGIASVVGPVIKNFETRVEEVVKSQHTLESSIDRLTRVLDKLLDDTPLPSGAQHAAKLSGIRKRVGSLSDTVRVIQGRINIMETMLSDPTEVHVLPMLPLCSKTVSMLLKFPGNSSEGEGSCELQG
ncbi:hypothetical protein R1sor_015671 [Riccia sorocarpa]|uniref:Biogenesis of lysosome-related organelles complex 1 subunit 7 n=1 Tax=Riccia sorocarpa TaxID=122646 RepID=A0ABD3HFK5_9MARC